MDNKKIYKNPVGRPKKKYNNNDINFKNIINISNDMAGMLVSFSIKNIILFKQIINLFKLLGLCEFYISFSKKYVKFFIIDENTKNISVIVDINITELIDYNFNMDINSITISCITIKMNDILTNINSNYQIAVFNLTKEYNIRLELINLTLNEHSISYSSVNIIDTEPMPVANTITDAPAALCKDSLTPAALCKDSLTPAALCKMLETDLNCKLQQLINSNHVSFEIPIKLIKKKLTILNKQCSTFIIELKLDSLSFYFEPSDRYGKYITNFNNMEKINYKNNNGYEFKVVVDIYNLLSFSNLSLAENITFYISRENSNMYCKTVLSSLHEIIINIPVISISNIESSTCNITG